MLIVGKESIIMPHTIIDAYELIHIPPQYLVWGYVRNQKELQENSISLEALSQVNGEFIQGSMTFQGNGAAFVQAFKNRIEHILEDNGAYFDGTKNKGHAQKGQNISFNIIQPYPKGPAEEGLFPTIDIHP